jgi:hypothetical protein
MRLGAVFTIAGLVIVAAYTTLLSGAQATADVPPIGDITAFLEQCPNNDPAYAQIRADFEIRREGTVIGSVPCTQPVSAMAIAQYTDELIIVQALRTIYYMEGGRQVPYPWTSGNLYDWMKSQIGGINLRNSGSYCCEVFDGRWFIVLGVQNQFERDVDREWPGLADRITVAAHETRHVQGFPHVGGCPAFPTQSFGCDQTYDESNLAPYGVEWWLQSKWLSGELNVGYSCPSPYVAAQIGERHMNAANSLRDRFVDTQPPLLTMPAQPGGPCLATPTTPSPSPAPTPTAIVCPGDSDCDGWANWKEEFYYFTNPFAACAATPQPNDEPTDAWPLDFDDNQWVDSADASGFLGRLGRQFGDPLYSNRYDLDLNGKINTADLGFLVGLVGTTCL